MSRDNSPLLVFLGVLASTFSLTIGLVALLTALGSFGRQAEYGYLISPGAGGILFILLGLTGAMGTIYYLERPKIAKGLLMMMGFAVLSGLLIFAVFQEWTGCLFLIAIMLVVLYASRYASKKSCSALLLFFSGLIGFIVAQLAITTLPYGWKTWAVSGVLFNFAGLIVLLEGHLDFLPRIPGQGRLARWSSRIFYAFLCLIIASTAIAVLMQVPEDAGPGLINAAASPASPASPASLVLEPAEGKYFPGSADYARSEKGCDCSNAAPVNASFSKRNKSCQEGLLQAEIVSPEDVRTFPQGESILFEAFGCGKEPYLYLWWSDQDGILNSQGSFSSSNLTAGWHTITLSVTDGSGRTASDSIELGVAPPSVCSDVLPRPRYYPVDTPCQDIWPNGTESCQEIEVCHPGLDYIVLDAVSCCNGTASSSPACAWTLEHSGGDNKRCRGLYIIRAFGPDAVYMQGYALFKACCSGYPECTRTSWPSLAGTISFQEGFNQNVQNLSCRPEEWGVSAWHSDTNMSQNSAVLGLFPAHATVNILQTGVCIDYAAALTTALRKAGYSNTEAMVAFSLGYDLPLLGSHPGHAYNLVKLPGDDRYHIVDTTGNGDGINLDGLPRYFWFKGNFMNQPVSIRVFDWWVDYCTKMSQYGLNDAGSVKTPDSSELCGC